MASGEKVAEKMDIELLQVKQIDKARMARERSQESAVQRKRNRLIANFRGVAWAVPLENCASGEQCGEEQRRRRK